jgi:hypothetical protein
MPEARLVAQKDRYLYLLLIAVQIVFAPDDMGDEEHDDTLTFVLIILWLLELRKKHPSTARRFRTIASFADVDCKSMFRFDKDHLFRLNGCLRLPKFRLQNRAIFVGVEALLIVLHRLHAPGRWRSVVVEFGSSTGKLSELFNLVIDHVYGTFCVPLMQDLTRYACKFEGWASVIRRKTAGAVDFVFTFLDGKFNSCCKPKIALPDVLYSGYYRDHGLTV